MEVVASCRHPVATQIHILRHGQSLHNVDRGYKHRDPPLTDTGKMQAQSANLPAAPDLIAISPMTRTIQTTKIAFSELIHPEVRVEIWPDLREAHDAICNKGVSRVDLMAKFPDIDFSQCSEDWDYPSHTFEDAVIRAEAVRRHIKNIADTGAYRNIYLVTHRGFISFLVQGERYDVCECRSFRFATNEEAASELRFGHNIDANRGQDFGPTYLLPLETHTSK